MDTRTTKTRHNASVAILRAIEKNRIVSCNDKGFVCCYETYIGVLACLISHNKLNEFNYIEGRSANPSGQKRKDEMSLNVPCNEK